jgi:hypothetical protein
MRVGMGYSWSEMYHSSTLAALTLIIIFLELLKKFNQKKLENIESILKNITL